LASAQVKPADLEQRLHLHQLHERCELMCLLTQLYCGPDPPTSDSIHDLHVLAASADADGSEAAAELLQELQAMRWPQCSEERLLQLLKLLGEAVFVAGSGAAGSLAGGAAGSQQLQAGVQQRGGWVAVDSQAANMQQLGEALVGGGVVC
jgi:anti-sigma factor RsiW